MPRPRPPRLFAGCRTPFGPLGPELTARLRAVVLRPSIETWEDAHAIILEADGHPTLWQAVCAIDPTFPTTGRTVDLTGHVVKEWARIPDQLTLLRAIRYARCQRRGEE